jgi:beta-glucosidase-like glycosyl hydrolase
MNDTFDFTSYVRSDRLQELDRRITLDPTLVAALVAVLDTFPSNRIMVGSPEWDQLVATIDSVTGMEDIDLTDFLVGDFIYKGGTFSDYMDDQGVRLDYEGDFEDEEPHQTTDTFAGPKGIEEMIKEVLKSKLTK